MSASSVIPGSVFLTGAVLIASFAVIQRRTGLPPKGILELVAVRIVNVVSNVVMTVLAGPMLALKVVVLGSLPTAVPWFVLGVTVGHQEPGFQLELLNRSVVLQRILFVAVTFSIGICWFMLVSTALHKDHGPPFSVLKFDREKYLPTQS